MTDLGNTAYVVLGMLAKGPLSGYDIKTVADRSVRFFWNLSYSQVYPELKRLTELGLVEPEAAARGDRQRTLYQITPSGRQALREWLLDGEEGSFELRDEMLLKLFFSESLSPEEVLAHIRAMRKRETEAYETLRRLDPHATAAGAATCKLRVLQAGLGLHSFYDEFLAGLERDLEVEIENAAKTGPAR